jgi:subtilisin family serine protease
MRVDSAEPRQGAAVRRQGRAPAAAGRRQGRAPAAGSGRQGRALGAALATLAATGWAVGAAALTASVDDPFFAAHQQWALTGVAASINAPAAWCQSTGAGVLIADLDTGVDFGHPDLAGKLVAGASFTSGQGDPNNPDGTGVAAVSDDVGHGTQTTGIMVAVTNNRRGIAAVAPDARALVVKVLKRAASPDQHGQVTGTGSSVDLIAAVRWSVDHGARIVNVSVGGGGITPDHAQQLYDAVRAAAARGVLVVIAGGNGGGAITDYRPIDDVALVVGGVGPGGQIAYYSNPPGPGVNLYAPGGDENQAGGPGDAVHNQIVTTALGGDYRSVEGTSAAAPMVSGAAALLMAHGMSAAAARQALIATAVVRGGLPEADVSRAIGGACAAATGAGPTPARSAASPAPGVAASASPSPAAGPMPSPPEGASPSPSAPPPRDPARPGGFGALPLAGAAAIVLAALGGLAWWRSRRSGGSRPRRDGQS